MPNTESQPETPGDALAAAIKAIGSVHGVTDTVNYLDVEREQLEQAIRRYGVLYTLEVLEKVPCGPHGENDELSSCLESGCVTHTADPCDRCRALAEQHAKLAEMEAK